MPTTHSPQHEISAQQTEDPSLARIGSFSDGVFAFAITLLILAIHIPQPTDADARQGLLTLLAQQWRSYLAWVLSFMFVGINWANHRVMFATFARANHVAFASPSLAVAGYVAMVFVYVLPVPRLVALKQRSLTAPWPGSGS